MRVKVKNEQGFAHVQLLVGVALVVLVVGFVGIRVYSNNGSTETSQETTPTTEFKEDSVNDGEEVSREQVNKERQNSSDEQSEQSDENDGIEAEANSYSTFLVSYASTDVYACKTSTRINLRVRNNASSNRYLSTWFSGGSRPIDSTVSPGTSYRYRSYTSSDRTLGGELATGTWGGDFYRSFSKSISTIGRC